MKTPNPHHKSENFLCRAWIWIVYPSPQKISHGELMTRAGLFVEDIFPGVQLTYPYTLYQDNSYFSEMINSRSSQLTVTQ